MNRIRRHRRAKSRSGDRGNSARPTKRAPKPEPGRWHAWIAIFALGVVLGGGLGGALALVSTRGSGATLEAALPNAPASVEELIETNIAPAAGPKLPEHVYDEGVAPPPVRDDSRRSASAGLDSKIGEAAISVSVRVPQLSPLPAPSPVLAPPIHAVAARTENEDAELPLWRKNAIASLTPLDQPVIAVILDDLGVARGHAELAIALPPEITLAFMTYAGDVRSIARRAREQGHELLLHFPMEPQDHALDPGPNALMVGLGRAELERRLDWGLSQFDGYVGLNNHMGSRFTLDQDGMRVVMETLKRRGLLFVDSKTTSDSVGATLAEAMDVAHATRDVFLDNEISAILVTERLLEAERIALAKGDAIAIGHPHPATIEALRAWIPLARARGIAIVPVSAVVMRRRLGIAG